MATTSVHLPVVGADRPGESAVTGRTYRVGMVDFVVDLKQPGLSGLSDLLWRLAAHLVQRGDRVHVVAPYLRTAALPAGPVLHTFRLPVVGYRNILGHLLIVTRAALELKRHGPFDVLHAQEYLSSAVLALLFPNTPVVLTTPGNIYERMANGNPFDRSTTLVYRLAATITARRAARVIAISEAMREWWIYSGTDPRRVVLIPNGVEASEFPEVDLRERVPGESVRLMFAGRLSPENGLGDLLRALALARARGAPATLDVLGEGPSGDALRSLAHELGLSRAVTWHGWVSYTSLPEHYAAADALIACHRSAGLPRVLQQAMFAGVPVIGTRITGITDHVIPGRTGQLVAPSNPEELAAAIEQLIAEPTGARTMADSAKARARALFSWDQITDRIRAEVYGPIVETRR